MRIDTFIVTLMLLHLCCRTASAAVEPDSLRLLDKVKQQPEPANSEVQSFTLDGRERRYLLDVPQNLKEGAGLILVAHGFGDSPDSIRKYSGFHKNLNEHNFVFAYLEGTKDKEGKRNHQVEYAFQNPKVDDVKYARYVVDKLVRQFHLDPKRVFCTGMSNGADFSYFLARQKKPFVKAIAPVAGTMMEVWDKHLTKQSRVSIMEVHGTADEVTLWQGDMANRDGWGAYLSTDAVAKWWVDTLGLTKKDHQEAGGLKLTRWSTDKDTTEYLLYTVVGGKHVWPERLGNSGKTLADEIVAFFEGHCAD
ncbi:MAG: hypothetical protein NT023_15190 [Armatimonadetes bacterium]|nr:hypothetical protein [Armatimonadota bacterium]